jgi:rhodanese-related sulfurtransferase
MIPFFRTCCAALAVCGVFSISLAAEHTKDTLPTVKKNVEDKKALIVDVREQSEWDAGHLDGAVLLPLSELKNGVDKEKLAGKLPKEKIVYTHCKSGGRCVSAAEVLQKLGYDVRPLKPGYEELLNAGFKQASK